MQPILAFTIVMFVWTIGELVSAKTKALISMMLVASMIFLVGFATNLLPHDLIQQSGLLGLGNAVIGVIIVHLGTTMSLSNLKDQWRTFVIGSLTVVVLSVALLGVSMLLFDRNVAIAGTAGLTGGTLSVLMVQDKAASIMEAGKSLGEMGGYSLAVLPLLILNLKNLIGFLVASTILKKEATDVRDKFRAGTLEVSATDETVVTDEPTSRMPAFLQTAYGTLFLLGLTVYISAFLSGLTNGNVNTFVIALLLGIILRHFGILKPNSLNRTDSFGLLMISIMVIAFGPLADVNPTDLLALVGPIAFFLLVGVLMTIAISFVIGKRLGYSNSLSIAVGLTTFFGFPGTMVLTKEAAAVVGETPEEVEAIEHAILPIMITAGFSTITITSVLMGGIIVNFMIGL